MKINNFKPYSDNVIFMDTEFSTNDPYEGEILSIGLVKVTGEELYLEMEFGGEANEWVQENILPKLTQEKVSKKVAQDKIREFVGDTKPYVVTYVTPFDVVYLHKLFESKTIEDTPFYWMPIDFASILFGLGMNPEAYHREGKEEFYKAIGLDTDKYHTHNALDDARLLREVYMKLADTEVSNYHTPEV